VGAPLRPTAAATLLSQLRNPAHCDSQNSSHSRDAHPSRTLTSRLRTTTAEQVSNHPPPLTHPPHLPDSSLIPPTPTRTTPTPRPYEPLPTHPHSHAHTHTNRRRSLALADVLPPLRPLRCSHPAGTVSRSLCLPPNASWSATSPTSPAPRVRGSRAGPPPVLWPPAEARHERRRTGRRNGFARAAASPSSSASGRRMAAAQRAGGRLPRGGSGTATGVGWGPAAPTIFGRAVQLRWLRSRRQEARGRRPIGKPTETGDGWGNICGRCVV
jgi:hypothetical protein